MYAIFSVVGLGFDSFLACLAIGCYARSWRERFRFAIAFGVCDAAAALAGSSWPHRIAEPLVLIYPLCVLLLVAFARRSRVMFCSLPLLLSVDNLFGGVPANLAPALGASSAVMALIGLSLASMGRDLFMASKAEV